MAPDQAPGRQEVTFPINTQDSARLKQLTVCPHPHVPKIHTTISRGQVQKCIFEVLPLTQTTKQTSSRSLYGD